MTQTAVPRSAAPLAARATDVFEVTTVSADRLHALIRAAGPLTASASAVLVTMLRAHLRAGRRYLRVDVGAAPVLDPAVLATLTDLHRRVAARGGMLVFENAGAEFADAIRGSELFVRTAD